jgi:hypothetical protein
MGWLRFRFSRFANKRIIGMCILGVPNWLKRPGIAIPFRGQRRLVWSSINNQGLHSLKLTAFDQSVCFGIQTFFIHLTRFKSWFDLADLPLFSQADFKIFM